MPAPKRLSIARSMSKSISRRTRKRSPLREGFSDTLSAFVVRLFGLMPHRLAQRIGMGLGWLLFWLPFATPHRVSRINIDLCFPELSASERRQMLRRNMIGLGRCAADCAQAWVNAPEFNAARVKRVEGLALFDAAHHSGQGILLITPHIGCWEFVNFYVCARHDTVALYKPSGQPAMDQLIRSGRERLKAVMYPTDERGVKALYTTLKKGKLTLMLPDHVPLQEGGMQAPFMGISALTGVLTARLASRTGAVVLACACLYDDDGDFVLHFFEPDPMITDRDLSRSVPALNRTLDTCIRLAPEQYQWSYKRFKKPPAGEIEPYSGRRIPPPTPAEAVGEPE